MKKYLFAILAIVAVLVSCSKSENPTKEEVKGVKLTLKASINNDGTKVTYTPGVPSGMKVDWEATEDISVVTFDGSGNVTAIDNFTSTGDAGRTTAVFTGTFTGGENPSKVIVIYPALENYSGDYYGTKEYVHYMGTDRVLWQIKADGSSQFAQNASRELRQTADNSTLHLHNYMIMSGAVDKEAIKTGSLTTTLSNQFSIIKFKCTFDASLIGKTINLIEIESYNGSGQLKNLFNPNTSWEYADIVGNPLAWRGTGAVAYRKIYADFAVPGSGTATLYLPVVFLHNNSAADTWDITVTVDDTERPVIIKTFTSDKTYQRGKMYSVSLNVE